MIFLHFKLLFSLIKLIISSAYFTVYWSDIIEYLKCFSHYREKKGKKKEKKNRYKK